ncbi:MAG TPA: glycoside hydrolase family 28 protein [Terriglobales bacterium]|jgi:polygalacturonase|nr:glycoside hydrolase family 28 protein [Terriglobales bacterium]
MSTKQLPGRRNFVRNLAVGLTAVPISGIAQAVSPGGSKSRASGQADRRYILDVRDFGAVPDGKTLATKSIQTAFDKCHEAGGGKVVIPPGRYLSAPLFLRSNMELELLPGAYLLGSTNFDDYPTIQGRWEGLDRTIFASLLTGQDLENVTISGRGTIDGQGQGWWKAHRETQALRRKLGLEGREPENPPGSPLQWPRPRLINLYRCKNVHISGIAILNSPSWQVHPVLCEDICIDGVTIWAPGDSPNTDGIDPDSCRLVRISNCYISTGDDCVVIKSGYKYQPGVKQIPSEDITVTNCVFGTGHAGVAIGSETSGGVRNVTVSNCVCNGTRRGLYIKSARGRGNIVENFRASNVVLKNITDTAVHVGMFYTGSDRTARVEKNEATPTFRNFHFSDIIVEQAPHGVIVEGLPENPIREFSLENVSVNGVGTGLNCSNTQQARFERLTVNSDTGPSFSFSDVRDLEISRFRSAKTAPEQVVIRMERVENVSVTSCQAPESSRALLEFHGPGSRDVVLALNRVPKGVQEVAFAEGADTSVVEKRA